MGAPCDKGVSVRRIRVMRQLACAAVAMSALSSCSPASTSPAAGVADQTVPARAVTATTQATPSPSKTSSNSTSVTDMKPPTPTGAKAMESVGQALGAKIAFYAIAKAAGLNDSTKMDQLASGICTRIASKEPATVGPWMRDNFRLRGDVAAKVAIAAIEFHCPQFKSLIGS